MAFDNMLDSLEMPTQQPPVNPAFGQGLKPPGAGTIDIKARTDELEGKLKPQVEKMKAIDEREKESVTSMISQGDKLLEKMMSTETPTPPKFEKLPDAPAKQYSDPMQALGSMGTILAVIGSLKTRAPLTSALNAAAASMQAFHKGDQEAIKLERENWNDNLARALKNNQEELAQYQAALRNANFDLTKASSQWRVIAAQTENQAMLAAIESRDPVRMYQLYTDSAKIGNEMLKMQTSHLDREAALRMSQQRFEESRADRRQARSEQSQRYADAQTMVVTGPDGKPYKMDKRSLPALPEGTAGITKLGAKSNNAAAMGGEAAFEKLKTLPPEQERELRIQAWNYIDKKLLPYRKGSGGGADRNDLVMAMAGKISDELGVSPQADSTSYSNLSKKADVIESQLQSFHNNLQTWDQLAKGQGITIGSKESKAIAEKLGKINFTGIKTVDEIKLKIQQEFDDPAAVALVTAASAAAFDYARIMSSQGQSAGQITDSARHEAQILVSKGYDDKARQGLMVALDSDTQGQIKGLMDQKEKVYDRLTGRKSDTGRRATDATGKYVETRKTDDGRTLGKKADGTIEEIK